MNSRLKRILFACCFLGIWGCGPREKIPETATWTVKRQPFAVWTPFMGTLEAERQETIFSKISEPTTLLWLAPEGSLVEKGDRIVSFDAAPLEASLTEAERDLASAEAGVDRLTKGEHPLRLMAVNSELSQLELDAKRARHHWEASLPLREQELLSPAEMEDLENQARTLEKSVENKRIHLQLLEDVIHPSEQGEVEAGRDASARQYRLLKEQMDATELTAEIDGMVMRLPLHISGEFRTLREGDMVYRNQRFMQVADLSTLAAQFEVPEDRISLVGEGNRVVVIPSAFPEMELEAEVSRVAAVALSVPGSPSWRKTFSVTAVLKNGHPQLRSGMSVRVLVLTLADEAALVAPRSFVSWDGNQPRIRVRTPEGELWRNVNIRAGNETHFSIRDEELEGAVLLEPPSS